MAIHTIRLRAPWKREREEDRLVWRRAFGCPTNLSEQETVDLVLRSDSATALAMLNGNLLGPAPAVYDVTTSLKTRNTLTLSILRADETEEEGREPPFDVRLEIKTQERSR